MSLLDIEPLSMELCKLPVSRVHRLSDSSAFVPPAIKREVKSPQTETKLKRLKMYLDFMRERPENPVTVKAMCQWHGVKKPAMNTYLVDLLQQGFVTRDYIVLGPHYREFYYKPTKKKGDPQ